MYKTIKKTFYILSNFNNFYFYGLIIFLIFSSCLEIIAIGSIYPLLLSFISEDFIFQNLFKKEILKKFSNLSREDFLFYFSISIGFFFMLAYLMRTVSFYFITFFHEKLKLHIRSLVMENYSNWSYSDFNKKKHSEILTSVMHETQRFADGVVKNYFILFREIFFIIIAVITFIIIKKEFLWYLIIFCLSSFLIYYFIKKTSYKVGKSATILNREFVRISYDIIKFYKIIDVYNIKNNLLFNLNRILKKISINNSILLMLPQFIRLCLELIIIFSVFAFLILPLTKSSQSIISSIPILGTGFIFIARLLPLFSSILGCLNSFKSNQFIVDKILEIKIKKKNFSKLRKINSIESIKLKKINFSYGEKLIFKNLNLDIVKNQNIGIIGESGVGKSTLINILLNYLIADNGVIFVNGFKVSDIENYRKFFSYAPQEDIILNDTIEKNIILESEKNMQLLNRILVECNLQKLHKNLKNTPIGENGSLISGGQKQRISIARALYKNSDVIILDEPTSNLDEKNEKLIIKAIRNNAKKSAKIIISHNKKILKICHKVYEIKGLKLFKV